MPIQVTISMCGESNNALTITGTMYWIAKQFECVHTYLICVDYIFPFSFVRVGQKHVLVTMNVNG